MSTYRFSVASIFVCGLLFGAADEAVAQWRYNDLTARTGAPLAGGNPMGYSVHWEPSQHVVYRGTDGHVHELYWRGTGWARNDLTIRTGAPLTDSDPVGYTYVTSQERSQHVVFRSSDNHIREFWWKGQAGITTT